MIAYNNEKARKSGGSKPPPYDYAALSSIFSMKMPYPVVGSLMRTKEFCVFCGFYLLLQVKGNCFL
jgi:hypothetical protein